MSEKNNSENLSEYIKDKLDENPIYTLSKDILVEKLAQAIEDEKIVHIIGANGTGKEYLINEVISPQMENDLNVKKITIYDNKIPVPSYKISKLLNEESSRLIILSRKKIVPKSKTVEEAIENQAFGKLLENAFDIYLPDLQEQFLEYPKIIESYTKKIFNKSAGQILINTVGYLETLISGLPNNTADLESIIKAEKTPKTINYSYKKNQQFGVPITFNCYLDVKSDRKKIWHSFNHELHSIELSKIIGFNDSFTKSTDSLISNLRTGTGRKHPRAVQYEQIKKYCISFLQSQNVENINNQIFEPIENKIIELESGKNITQTIIENIYIFTKSETIFEITPQIKSIEDFNTLVIQSYKHQNHYLKFNFQLKNESFSTKLINITTNEASFLSYLASERKMNGQGWLKEPENHFNLLEKISSSFGMMSSFIEEIETKPIPIDNSKTWIWDFRNKFRKSIVKNINKSLNEVEEIAGKLIYNIKSDSSRKGNYSLANSIERIELPSMK